MGSSSARAEKSRSVDEQLSNTGKYDTREIKARPRSRERDANKITDNHLVCRWCKKHRLILSSMFPPSFIYVAFLCDSFDCGGEHTGLTARWTYQREENAILIIVHYRLSLGNIPFLVTRRSVCLMVMITTRFKTITPCKKRWSCNEKIKDTTIYYICIVTFQTVSNKGIINGKLFLGNTNFEMLQDLFKENNYPNDVSHCKVKDDIELSLIVSPRVRIRFAYLSDILWWKMFYDENLIVSNINSD